MTKLPEKPPDLTREELWALVRELGTGLIEASEKLAKEIIPQLELLQG